MRSAILVVGLLAGSGAASGTPAEPPIRALLITGHNNHNWWYTSRVHEDTLEATGRFDVDVTDTPWTTLADAAALKQYGVFVLDYNDSQEARRWGEIAEANFTRAVQEGTGVVAIHAANNAFAGWTDYERMLGLMWRDGTGHGKFHPFDVEIVDHDHPITQGLGTFKSHPDELYHKLVNSQGASFHLLAQAMSATDTGGTGNNEPMAFTLEFGKGRVFATPLGHVWVGSEESKSSILDPNFRTLLARGAEWAATGKVTLTGEWTDSRPHNTLNDQEKKDGWALLFDGKSTENFRGFKADKFPDHGWTVRDGVLWRLPGEAAGDIVTRNEYGNFELAVDWMIAAGGNSGIIYHADENHGAPWETGPEMQILDDSGHPDSTHGKNRAGALYDLVACSQDVCRPPGQWNHARIVVRGTHVEHWLNGFPVVSIDTDSDEYKKALAESKWTQYPDFGSRARGHISLQDHGDEVRFRDIKIREIP